MAHPTKVPGGDDGGVSYPARVRGFTIIGRPRPPRMRASCASRASRTFEPSGRSQPSKPRASNSEQRTHPKVCGGPNTTRDLLSKRLTITHLHKPSVSLLGGDAISKVCSVSMRSIRSTAAPRINAANMLPVVSRADATSHRYIAPVNARPYLDGSS
jgi:hypothetical protein